jgi:hypothetical protein
MIADLPLATYLIFQQNVLAEPVDKSVDDLLMQLQKISS